uniref:Band 3 cytoplasmic domain-containing protein n=1 Tax=Romanomermis culicivorax TaxID=13658 RepID=A0A915KH25_ROMCU
MEIINNRRNSIKHEDNNGQMFVELFQLSETEEVVEWTASARWIKYEEDTEGVDNHWGRPHVSFLRLKSLTTLKNVISKGSLIFDPPNVTHFDQILHSLASQMMRKFDMNFVESEKIASLLLYAKNRRPDHKINAPKFTRKLSSSTAIDQSVENKVHPIPTVDCNMNEPRKGSLRSTVIAPHLLLSHVPEDAPAADESAPTSPTGVDSPHHATKVMKRVFSFRRMSFTSFSEFDHHLQV